MKPTRRIMAVAAGTGVAVIGALLAPAQATAEPQPAVALAGKTVFLDPGHQGSATPEQLSKPVPDGNGGVKDCQTTGATGVNGVPEHKIVWEIGQIVKSGLEQLGAKVILSRGDDTGWGGCVSDRINAANAAKADLAINLHADSTTTGRDDTRRGFHLIVPALPVPDATVTTVQGGAGKQATEDVRDALKKAGLPVANYLGDARDGVLTRKDIAAANLTRVPNVFTELGNLSNPADAELLSGREGQVKAAAGLIAGASAFLTRAATPATPGVPSTQPQTPATTPGTPALPPGTERPQQTTEDPGGIDLSGVSPFVRLTESLGKVSDVNGFKKLLEALGPDAGAGLLKAVLSAVYALAGGKLPV